MCPSHVRRECDESCRVRRGSVGLGLGRAKDKKLGTGGGWRSAGWGGKDAIARVRTGPHHVCHVLARRDGGDALVGKLHRRDLLKNLGLQVEGNERQRKERRKRSEMPAQQRRGSACRLTSLSGGISQLLSQSHAPFPSEMGAPDEAA